MTENHDCLYEREFGSIAEQLKNIDGKLASIDGKVGKQNGRIGKLENFRYFLVGLAIGIPFVMDVIMKALEK